MILKIFFLISILGMIMIIILDRSRSFSAHLQSVKNWCSIDSVRFEKTMYTLKHDLHSYAQTVWKKVSTVFHRGKDIVYTQGKELVRHSKKTVRKKLFPEKTSPRKTSVFIEKMK